MKVQTFLVMQSVYNGNRYLEPDDLEQREKILVHYPYSVIVEGEHNEFDNLRKWIERNISKDGLNEIYYGKIDYDYGFAEFFLSDQSLAEKLTLVVPNIYTTYPHSTLPGKICKSDGTKKWIINTPEDLSAIVYPSQEEQAPDNT